MDIYFLCVKVIVLLVFTLCHVTYIRAKFPVQGVTYPSGDILLEYNTSTPLEITCVIWVVENETEAIQNNSKLYFKRNNNSVPDEKITRLNDTAIKLVEENPEKMSSFYSCMFNNSTIGLNNVVVGTKPQKVKDFKCLGMSWYNLTCSWTPPNNFVPTKYNLSYTFPEQRAGQRKNDRFQMVNSANQKPKAKRRPTDCNVTDDKARNKKMCFWSIHTRPHYRQVAKHYNFTLKARNDFGVMEQNFLFDHYKNILSSPPENLSCINSTTSSLFLFWKVPTEMVPFSEGLQHRILYQCGFGPKIWQDGGLIETFEVADVYFNLTNLKNAHDLCDIRVAIRVKEAYTEDMWSANSSVTALTSSTIPGAPPRIDVGSFQTEITSQFRDIYVYWQQIPVEIKNADNFHYIVSDNEDNKLAEITNSYARYTNMELNKRYKFTIKSKNSEGESLESAVLEVPGNDEMIGEPVSFKKVAFENGLFKLSWGKPKKGAEYVQNYTLFWCINDKDRPYQCTGYLNWTQVPASTTEYNITVPENTSTQVAVSANNATSSSGMVWAACTLIHNKSITKIKEVWISSVNSNSISLRWALGCADASDNVAGYVIYYCPRRTKDPACQKQLNHTVNNPDAVSATVGDLIPYTTYRLTVSVVDKHGTQSHESEPLYNTTYEGIPSVPYGLKAVRVTNSSITLSWKPPNASNGFLRPYTVFFNNNFTKTRDNGTSWTLTDLVDDRVYNISVSACTQQCSEKSVPILIKTDTGHPQKIQVPVVGSENNSLVFSWWRPPRGSEPKFYELSLKSYSSDGNNKTLPIINTTELKYVIACDEENKHTIYFFKVRAVNIEKDGKRLLGEWSDESKTSCSPVPSSSNLIWVTIVVVCLFVLILMLLSGKKLYIHLNEMKTVELKMPPGLDPQIDPSWSQPKHKPKLSSSDADRLLHETYMNPGDSSGCSSGQESVASDSGSSIASSTLDSGTEQPRTPTDEEPKILLTSINALKVNGCENQPYNNGYSMYGISDTTSANAEIELMSVPKSNTIIESPYLTCDQIMKPIEEARSVNNTYVPLNNTQDKNPPYVMAANKNVITSNLFYPNVIPNVDERAYVQVADVNQTSE